MGREESALYDFTQKKRKLRLNCAQAIMKAYDPAGLNRESPLIREFASYGQGKAPHRYCGAYYAAHYLLESNFPEKTRELKEFFIEKAGHLECREIRRAKRLSCRDCVKQAGLYLNSVIPNSSDSTDKSA